jgi:hypothetical protein
MTRIQTTPQQWLYEAPSPKEPDRLWWSRRGAGIWTRLRLQPTV